MRSTLRWLLPAALTLSVAGCTPDDEQGVSTGSVRAEARERRVVVLFTTDEHANLFAVAPEVDDFGFPFASTAGAGALVGGVARRAAILDAERDAAAARKADTITLSAGDFSQGTLASAAFLPLAPELVLLERMRYDAVAIGNHELDLGPAALAASIGTAAAREGLPPLVLTNAFFSDASAADDALAALHGPGNAIAPSRVLHTRHGIRIGVVASMGVAAGTVAGNAPPLRFWSEAATTNEQRFASVAATLQAAVTELREVQKVDAVILLGHGGIGSSPAAPGEDELLAMSLSGVDLVVSGHTHLSTPAPRLFPGPGGTVVPVVQAKAFGREVGKVELVFPGAGGATPYLDPAGTAFLPVDDRTLPTTSPQIAGELQLLVGYLEAGNPSLPEVPSFLEETLSYVTGATVTDDPAQLGDLYHYPLGKTSFPIVGLARGETNAMNLDTDAMLAAANQLAPTFGALQANGPIRGDLLPGRTQVVTFADVYRVVPNGGDPTANPLTDPNALPGFPLVRVLIPAAALRAAFEGALLQSMLDGDFFIGASGLVVRYDQTRPPYDPTIANGVGPGWVTYLAIVQGGVETVLYDVSDPTLAPYAFFNGNPADPTWVLPIVSTYYVASFASAFGIPLVDPTDGQLVGPTNPLADTILRRLDGSAVKDHEALGAYVLAECAANAAAPGFIPSRYDATTAEGAVPRRVIDCTGGCP